ncbi:MAG: polymer-forming cytoskeletal protein [Proteobacteria bacterium]|nr:polymer-forming cytoskeletal protein [Pseudomonadota bacterium]MCP4916325.1 polymer-forming cytoskeletal protein [Pseudomonadota bacterium]
MNLSDGPLNALLGKGAVYEGDLSFEGRVRVDGLFRGRIYTEEVLEVGPEGRIEGDVDAAVVVLAGTIVGKVIVRELLRIQPGGLVRGEARAKLLEVRPGGRFEAQVTVG